MGCGHGRQASHKLGAGLGLGQLLGGIPVSEGKPPFILFTKLPGDQLGLFVEFYKCSVTPVYNVPSVSTQDPELVIKQMVADGNFWNGFRCEEDKGLVARSALEASHPAREAPSGYSLRRASSLRPAPRHGGGALCCRRSLIGDRITVPRRDCAVGGHRHLRVQSGKLALGVAGSQRRAAAGCKVESSLWFKPFCRPPAPPVPRNPPCRGPSAMRCSCHSTRWFQLLDLSTIALFLSRLPLSFFITKKRIHCQVWLLGKRRTTQEVGRKTQALVWAMKRAELSGSQRVWLCSCLCEFPIVQTCPAPSPSHWMVAQPSSVQIPGPGSD
uniref:uncharacterized protein LOC128930785 n=1 Tax=Callithrix jacchus TaxID=9483 RepID=UPI0023DD2249|nr:uncharacterized protein LOC128930785 [Callithrix jacchus]